MRCLCIKLRSIDALVLSRLFHTQTTQSTTATTSIVFCAIERIACESKILRHCEIL
ncbi:hypothetical protein ACWIUD_05205 [Helicobacter sp. 23-1044]